MLNKTQKQVQMLEFIKSKDGLKASSLIESLLKEKVMNVLLETRKQVSAEAFDATDLSESLNKDGTEMNESAEKYTVKSVRVPGVSWKKHFVMDGKRVIDGPHYSHKSAREYIAKNPKPEMNESDDLSESLNKDGTERKERVEKRPEAEHQAAFNRKWHAAHAAGNETEKGNLKKFGFRNNYDIPGMFNDKVPSKGKSSIHSFGEDESELVNETETNDVPTLAKKYGYKKLKTTNPTGGPMYSHPEGHKLSINRSNGWLHTAAKETPFANKSNGGATLASLERRLTQVHGEK